MVCAVEFAVFVDRRVEHVAGHKEIVKLKAVKIAHRLNACDLHLDRKTALASAFFKLIPRFTVERVGRPYATRDIGKVQLPKDCFRAICLLDLDIIRGRRVVVGHALVAVRLGRDHIPAPGRFAVQTSRRTEHDVFCRAGEPAELLDIPARKRCANPAECDRKRFSAVFEQINRTVAVYVLSVSDPAHGKPCLQLL